MTFVLSKLNTTGGLYVNEHTVLADYPVEMRLLDLVLATDPSSVGNDTDNKEYLHCWQPEWVYLTLL